ncbi:MAG: hypothetical protein DI552_00595 [Brevundimonas sp.]|uniref:hypothetical protein n=1 Tax=Brevundimonas sp. TaxID=1871086 RepID=UPI000DBC3BCE|nr:hypothetical protein [Brevundimonas sp.]PZU62234.1 MAG: hypothetical protein DI552_00595 [Brevundimonas sp.]
MRQRSHIEMSGGARLLGLLNAVAASEPVPLGQFEAMQFDIDQIAGLVGALTALAPLANAALTGAPTAPTAAFGANTTQISTTAFVQSAIQAIIGMAPEDLDTLAEIAARLQTEESNYAALVSVVAGKLAKAANLSDLADAAAARDNLGLGALATLASVSPDQIALPNGPRLLGRTDAGAGPAQSLTLAQVKAALGLGKADVGLGQVDNTADADKPVSTPQATALATKADRTDGVVVVTGAAYTLQADDNGKVIEFANAGAVAVTLPADLPAGFNAVGCQAGAGKVSLSAAAGAALRNRQGFGRSTGQWAEWSMRIRANTGGAAAEWVISGDLEASA